MAEIKQEVITTKQEDYAIKYGAERILIEENVVTNLSYPTGATNFDPSINDKVTCPVLIPTISNALATEFVTGGGILGQYLYVNIENIKFKIELFEATSNGETKKIMFHSVMDRNLDRAIKPAPTQTGDPLKLFKPDGQPVYSSQVRSAVLYSNYGLQHEYTYDFSTGSKKCLLVDELIKTVSQFPEASLTFLQIILEGVKIVGDIKGESTTGLPNIGITQVSQPKGFNIWYCPDVWAIAPGDPTKPDGAYVAKSTYCLKLVISTKMKLWGTVNRTFERVQKPILLEGSWIPEEEEETYYNQRRPIFINN